MGVSDVPDLFRHGTSANIGYLILDNKVSITKKHTRLNIGKKQRKKEKMVMMMMMDLNSE